MSDNTTARLSLALIAPLGGNDPDKSFVATANRIMGWNIDHNGGAYLNEAAVDRVDRLVAALLQIRDGAAVNPQAVAQEALK